VARIGLQLWSVREECERDLEGTLRAIARMGYDGVEPFALHGHAAEDVAGWLRDLGLEACSRHVGLDALEDLDSAAAEAAALGVGRLVVSWVDPEIVRGEPEALADRIADAAALVDERGLSLGYHNHDAEVLPLGGGGAFLELLLARNVFLEPDLGWAWWAGSDPVALLERARGRCPLVHVKDFQARGVRAFCPVGDGAIDYARVAPAAVEAGAEWLIVEQDESDGPPLDDAERSLEALRRML
jgi:sugar phosphate isomerase/epimerase